MSLTRKMLQHHGRYLCHERIVVSGGAVVAFGQDGHHDGLAFRRRDHCDVVSQRATSTRLVDHVPPVRRTGANESVSSGVSAHPLEQELSIRWVQVIRSEHL